MDRVIAASYSLSFDFRNYQISTTFFSPFNFLNLLKKYQNLHLMACPSRSSFLTQCRLQWFRREYHQPFADQDAYGCPNDHTTQIDVESVSRPFDCIISKALHIHLALVSKQAHTYSRPLQPVNCIISRLPLAVRKFVRCARLVLNWTYEDGY